MKRLKMNNFFDAVNAGVLYTLDILWSVVIIAWESDPIKDMACLMEDIISDELC